MNRSYQAKKRWFLFFIGLTIGSLTVLSYPCSVAQAPVIKPPDDQSRNKERIREDEIQRLQQSVYLRERKLIHLKNAFQANQPEKPYLVVNSAANRIRLLKAGHTIHEGKCSTGSYILLKAKGEREWLFRTPRGLYRVTVKLKDPWWYKPDWAYIEENIPIPSIYSAKRYQPGVLGDYALGFGNGYLVHGTLYKRFLGMPVTHGCVRLDDDDMKLIFNTLSHGSRIYIY